MAFTQFYAQTTGSNLNSGSTTSDSATLTYASGNWVASTGVFTVASGNPSSDGVAVGDFVSVYADGSTVTGFVGRVTARDTTTITVSLTAKSGTAPTDGTGNRTLKVGGAWKGCNGTEAFPFDFAAGTMTNSSNNPPHIAWKAGTYSITGALTHSPDTGAIWHEGYTTTIGDGGFAIIDGGTSGASYKLLNVTGKNTNILYFKFQNNGATGSVDGVGITGNENMFYRCVFKNLRGMGLASNAVSNVTECEFTACNQSNTSTKGGVQLLSSGSVCLRNISHHNTGSNATGFFLDQSMLVQGCIAWANGNDGFSSVGDVNQTYLGCDAYDNGRHGFNMQTTASMCANFYNCNALKNVSGGWNFGTNAKNGFIKNCGFGSGTQANGTDVIEVNAGIRIEGKVTYTADTTPWNSPSTGDFRITSSQAKNTGTGYYLQQEGGYSGTVAYPDIGAGQHLDSGGSSSAGLMAVF